MAYYASRSKEISQMEQDHMDLVRRKAGECMVLLKNDGTLPLRRKGRIALFGNGARHTVKGGTGSGDVNSRFVVNIEEGLEKAGFHVVGKSWLDAYDKSLAEAKDAYMKKLEERAEREGSSVFLLMMDEAFMEQEQPLITREMLEECDTDTAIYVISRNSGEGADRFNCPGDYDLLPSEMTNLRTIGEHFDRTILLLNTGGVINAGQFREIPGINAILLISQSGNQIGSTVADVLCGETCPCGKLTATWAKRYEDYPCSDSYSHNNGNWHQEYYKEGIYVGYRYFDTFGIEPAYCFGYGLNYTDFRATYKSTRIQGEDVTVTMEVRNIGAEFTSREILQLYVSAPAGKIHKPYQELRAFAKTGLLSPGQAEEISLTLRLRDLASFSEADSAWIMEAGDYLVRVGTNSRDTKVVAVLTLEQNVVTQRVKNLRKGQAEWQEISPDTGHIRDAEDIREVPRLVIDPKVIPCETIVYQQAQPLTPVVTDQPITLSDVKAGRYTLSDLVSQLTIQEMAELCVGSVRDGLGLGEGTDNVVGSASAAVPGAAGDTTRILAASRGIGNLIMADGPAGLRLTPYFCTDRNGVLREGGMVYGDMTVEIKDRGEDDIEYYQYCTAIPIASLLASSWDMDLIEGMGDIVGEEMERFHVNMWLAPGMNIQRNPLCGRNFEYYSEDPLLSGLCAAAETSGVQKHKGCGVTLKHYACNNQEDNRFFVNEYISERALREIYLRNFQICIEKAKPYAMMSAYNLINDVHAANDRELLNDVARCEWGFDGIVMTDWFASQAMCRIFAKPDPQYSHSDPVLCISAGNELQMPGSQENADAIAQAVEDGSLSLADLQESARRMIELVMKLG